MSAIYETCKAAFSTTGAERFKVPSSATAFLVSRGLAFLLKTALTRLTVLLLPVRMLRGWVPLPEPVLQEHEQMQMKAWILRWKPYCRIAICKYLHALMMWLNSVNMREPNRQPTSNASQWTEQIPAVSVYCPHRLYEWGIVWAKEIGRKLHVEEDSEQTRRRAFCIKSKRWTALEGMLCWKAW